MTDKEQQVVIEAIGLLTLCGHDVAAARLAEVYLEMKACLENQAQTIATQQNRLVRLAAERDVEP